MFKRKRKQVARRCWYSSAVDLPGTTARQVWHIAGLETLPVRVTRYSAPWFVECEDPRAEPKTGAAYEIGEVTGGSRLTMHFWRDLPEIWVDDAWVFEDIHRFLDSVRVAAGIELGASLPRDPRRPKTGPGVARRYVDREQVSERVFLPAVTPQRVWDLIRPAEAALYDPDVVEAYVEAGTGPGVGEIQVCVSQRKGIRTVSRCRVVHEEPPFLALTEIIDDDEEWSIGLSYRLCAQDDGTWLQLTGSRDHEPDVRVIEFLANHRDFAAEFGGWIRRMLAAEQT